MEWHEGEGLRWLRAELGGARVAFSTRLGGVSEGVFRSLNLGVLGDDEPAAVAENHHRLAASLGLDPSLVAVGHQVHGVELARHEDSGRLVSMPPARQGGGAGGALPRVDGHVLTRPGTAALVLAADCLPLALAGPRGAAMLHCGWRGLAAGIVARGAAAVGATHAAIGPGIGACCYEVGPEVLSAFAGLQGVADGRMLDLPGVARALLREAGVAEVEEAGLCTSCEEGLFFSHRRDAGRTGRQAGVAWLADGEE